MQAKSLLLVVVLLVVLSGCTAPAPTAAPAAQAPTTAPAATSAPAATTAAAVNLDYAMHIGAAIEQAQKFYTDLFTEYMAAHPNVKVTFNPTIGAMVQDEYNTKLLVDLKAGTGPCIITPTESTLIKFIKAKLVEPVPDNVAEFVKANAINQAVLDAVTGPDGKIYGIPYLGDWPAMFYNTDMFQAAGIANPPTNWQELVDDAKKLTKTDAQGNITTAGFFVRKSGAQLGTFEKWYPFFTGNGGKLFDDQMTKATFNSPEGVEALQFYVDLMAKQKVDSFEAAKGDTDGFIGGNVAMYFREPDNISGFKAEAPNLHYGTALIPNGKQTAKGMATITPLAVTTACTDQQAAWDLLLWMAAPEQDARRAKALVVQPILKGTAADPYFKEDKLLQPFLEQQADVFPAHLLAHDMEIALGAAVEAALHGSVTPQQALDKAAEEINVMLKEQ